MRRATDQHHHAGADDRISIHALHEESDPTPTRNQTRNPKFQSTLSMRRATKDARPIDGDAVISIHALHEESDGLLPLAGGVLVVISIHALHEESDASYESSDAVLS